MSQPHLDLSFPVNWGGLNLKILLALGINEMKSGVFLSKTEEGGPHKRINGNPGDIALFLLVGLFLSSSPTLGTLITQT